MAAWSTTRWASATSGTVWRWSSSAIDSTLRISRRRPRTVTSRPDHGGHGGDAGHEDGDLSGGHDPASLDGAGAGPASAAGAVPGPGSGQPESTDSWAAADGAAGDVSVDGVAIGAPGPAVASVQVRAASQLWRAEAAPAPDRGCGSSLSMIAGRQVTLSMWRRWP